MIMWALHLRQWLQRHNVVPGDTTITIAVSSQSEYRGLVNGLLQIPDLTYDQYEAFKTGKFFAYGIEIKIRERE